MAVTFSTRSGILVVPKKKSNFTELSNKVPEPPKGFNGISIKPV